MTATLEHLLRTLAIIPPGSLVHVDGTGIEPVVEALHLLGFELVPASVPSDWSIHWFSQAPPGHMHATMKPGAWCFVASSEDPDAEQWLAAGFAVAEDVTIRPDGRSAIFRRVAPDVPI